MKATKIFFMLAFSMLATGAYAQKNLIKNGGFEDELYDWNNNTVAKTTPWDYKEGKNSCVISVANTSSWVGMDQIINIPKNAPGLELSGWIKTTNVIRGKDEWAGAIFSIEFLDKRDNKVGDANIARFTGDHDWELLRKNVKIPAGAVSFKILLALGFASGTLQADGITAKVLDQAEVAKL